MPYYVWMAAGGDTEAELEEKIYDRSWIADNLHLFAPLARDGFQSFGRGAILVNLAELILRRGYEEGHPFNYHAPSDAWREADVITDTDTRKRVHNLLDAYAPDQEFVLVLVKLNRCVIHRLPLSPEPESGAGVRDAEVDAETDNRQERLICTDFWARGFRLTSPHTAEWLYRIA